jgi:phenylacetate-CoA ligase
MQDDDFRDYVTADIQRHIGWAGWKLGDQHAFIWGAPVSPPLRKKLRNRIIDRTWSRFILDAFSLDDKAMTTFAQRVCRQKAKILFGYVSSVYEFARFVQRSQKKDITFDGIFTTSEVLLPSVRQFIEETFQSRIFNRYGTLELGGVACECENHAGSHVSVENNYVEILCDGSPVESGVVGDLIITNLNNLGMPFIRYSIEDAGAWHNGKLCPCGRVSPRLSGIEGRLVDSFHTRDGRMVWSGFAGAGFRCLTHSTIKQFQVVQKSLDKMVVRLVQDGNVPQSILDEISQAIRVMYGDNVVVDFEFPDEIPPLPSGKHLYARSELNKSVLNNVK